VTTSTQTPTPGIGSQDEGPRLPALTFAVLAVTLAVSVTALLSPALMNASTRDLPQLRAGQWWRVVTPVLVQPSGWGQLVFNLLGLLVVGIALQRHVGWSSWLSIYVVGGVGSVAVVSAWNRCRALRATPLRHRGPPERWTRPGSPGRAPPRDRRAPRKYRCAIEVEPLSR
jgi:hypothetical protein